MEKLIITTNEEKKNILKTIEKENKLHRIKFMSKDEFFSHYYFKITDEVYLYLMEKYEYKYDVVTRYLNYLYIIDINEQYTEEKLIFLQKLKKELIEKNLLVFNNGFKEYLKDKEIEVLSYERLEKYEEDVFLSLNAKIKRAKENELKVSVYETETIEEEILFVITKIHELLKSGVIINDIFIANADDEYNYLLGKLFSYFHIPINLNITSSIYETKEVQNYLRDDELLLDHPTEITKKLISVINSLDIEINSEKYKKILIEKLKTTSLPAKKQINAVNMIDLEKETDYSNKHIFVVGLNQNKLPKIRKDEDYISDHIKESLPLFTTDEKNAFEYDYIYRLLSNIPNLYLSYKKRTSFNEYYPSNLIKDFNLEVKKYEFAETSLSTIYNQIILGQKLDRYHKYGYIDDLLPSLYSFYKKNNYKHYNNQFSGINHDQYLEWVKYKINLSYSNLNDYNLCAFRYYIKHVLKIEPFNETITLTIGTICHELLESMDNDDFTFDTYYQKILSEYELEPRDKVIIGNLKNQMKTMIDMINKQKNYTHFKDTFYEEKIRIPLNKANFLSVNMSGSIDKIMYDKHINDAYYALIDYKTGSVDSSLVNLKYGLSMQLPIYLYLMSNSKLFNSPIFTGFYYQKLIHSKENYKKGLTLEQLNIDRYKLNGYSVDDEELLSKFDITYKDSEVIKSMKLTDKGFSGYSKTLSDEDVYNLITYTTKIIDKQSDNIINADFSVNPKIIGKDNLSCQYCTFKDLCFVKEEDKQYLEKEKDLSFLGGDYLG